MDLILFSPPRYRNGLHFKFNNALLWLASYAQQRGVEVRVVPLTDEHFAKTVEEEIATHKPKFVAISCKWWDTLFSSTHIASIVKRCDPGIITIAGGQTASFFAQPMVENTDFDVVIRGDGEEPLYRLVTGREPFLNCVFKGDTQLVAVRKQYVQTAEHVREISLIADLDQIISDTSVLNSYIWTGKGCAETCAYCSANAVNNVRNFGRAKHIYRPREMVLRDIAILSAYPNSDRITVDFDPVRGLIEQDYYLNLFAALEKKKHNIFFCSWSLPTRETIDALAETFNFVELSIDLQSGSERLRKFLGERRFLKPFFPDEKLDEILTYIHERYDNFTIDLSTLMGLPFEQVADVEAIKPFSDYFFDKFSDVRYPYVSPMNVEPGSMVHMNPNRYNMVLFRETFADFLRYTQRTFDENINCYQPETYADGVYHPLGACSREDYDNRDFYRIYETWKEIQANVDQRSREKTLSRAVKYKRYGLQRVGLLGGIDRKYSANSTVE